MLDGKVATSIENQAVVACADVKIGLESYPVVQLSLRFVSSCSRLRVRSRGSKKAEHLVKQLVWSSLETKLGYGAGEWLTIAQVL
jgi:hypothetical protein